MDRDLPLFPGITWKDGEVVSMMSGIYDRLEKLEEAEACDDANHQFMAFVFRKEKASQECLAGSLMKGKKIRSR